MAPPIVRSSWLKWPISSSPSFASSMTSSRNDTPASVVTVRLSVLIATILFSPVVSMDVPTSVPPQSVIELPEPRGLIGMGMFLPVARHRTSSWAFVGASDTGPLLEVLRLSTALVPRDFILVTPLS